MITQQDWDAFKERMNSIDPMQTEAMVQIIATPDDLEIIPCGGPQEISWILKAVAAAVITEMASSKTGAAEHETTIL